MTIQDFINSLTNNQAPVFIYYALIILTTAVLLNIIKSGNVNNLKYVASAIVYGVCVPGIFSLLLSFYALFLSSTSLLEVSITVYFLPVIMMVAVLYALNKKLKMKLIPGFDRLSGLMILLALTMLIIFVLQRTYFGVLFIGGIFQLLIVFIILFLLLKLAWTKLTR